MTIAMQIINPLFGGFIPTDIPGLQLWLDANDPATLFQDSGLTTPAVLDGDPIGGWSDKSGNTNNAGQAVGAKRPTFRTAVLTGKPVARLDGVDDFMTYPVINMLPGTVFVVMTEAVLSGFHAMIGNSGADVGFEATDVVPSRFFRVFNIDSVLITSSSINTLIPNIAVLDINTTDINLYYNNVNIGTASHTQISFNINSVGTRNGFGLFNGDIAEILVYTSVLSPAQRNDVNQYLTTKWGI